jgi:nucleoside-diphosphate-sugar epimerase
MDVLITGGSGFLGTHLATELAGRGGIDVGGDSHDLGRVTIWDRRPPPAGARENANYLPGDLRDLRTVKSVLRGAGPLVVFHLASAMSSDCERDPDLAFATNVNATVQLLSLLRSTHRANCWLVMASSVAAAPPRRPRSPTSVYGVTKRSAEQWLALPAFRADVACVSVRLPTVIIRNDAMNGAASGYLSVAARDARAGKRVRISVSPEHKMLVASYRVAVRSLLAAVALTEVAVPPSRVVCAPGVTTTAREVVDEVARLAGFGGGISIEFEQGGTAPAIVANWPASWDPHLEAPILSQVDSDDVTTIVSMYLREDELLR